MMRHYITDCDGELKSQLSKVRNSGKLSEKNKSLILGYHDHDVAIGLSLPRLTRKLISLRQVAERFGVEYDRVTKEDYERALSQMQRNGASLGTIWTDKKILKVFHKWINGGETYPECVKWFKFTKQKSHMKASDMLTQEEVKSLIHHCLNRRDKALVSLLWESGGRIGEIGTLKIKDVVFDEFGCKVTVNGKTGVRTVRVIDSAAYLLEWLNNHPCKSNPDSFLWVNLAKAYAEEITYQGFAKVLKAVSIRAKIQKPINPHNFRHSRATYMSQFLTEAQMKEYFGWTQDSGMAARYVHLSGKQVDDAILRLHGLVKEDRKEDLLKRKPCPRCKTLNDVNNSYCTQCWLPLTQQAAVEAEERQQKEQVGVVALMKILDKYRDNPAKLTETLRIIETGGAQA